MERRRPGALIVRQPGNPSQTRGLLPGSAIRIRDIMEYYYLVPGKPRFDERVPWRMKRLTYSIETGGLGPPKLPEVSAVTR
jgi:hypothetical protein